MRGAVQTACPCCDVIPDRSGSLDVLVLVIPGRQSALRDLVRCWHRVSLPGCVRSIVAPAIPWGVSAECTLGYIYWPDGTPGWTWRRARCTTGTGGWYERGSTCGLRTFAHSPHGPATAPSGREYAVPLPFVQRSRRREGVLRCMRLTPVTGLGAPDRAISHSAVTAGVHARSAARPRSRPFDAAAAVRIRGRLRPSRGLLGLWPSDSDRPRLLSKLWRVAADQLVGCSGDPSETPQDPVGPDLVRPAAARHAPSDGVGWSSRCCRHCDTAALRDRRRLRDPADVGDRSWGWTIRGRGRWGGGCTDLRALRLRSGGWAGR